MKYKVSVIQYEPLFKEKEHNLNELLTLSDNAIKKGAKLLVWPEMCTTGYCFYNREEILPLCEQIPEGSTVKKIVAFAKKNDCYIVFGMAERQGTNLYNAAVLIGPEGYLGKYRKIHSFVADNKWAKDGDEQIKVFSTKIGNISMLICMDLNIPEAPRLCSVLGADIVCVPVNWYGEVLPSSIWRNRAYENQAYYLIANRWGEEKTVKFGGGSSVISPEGKIQEYLQTGNGIIMSEVTLPIKSNESLPPRQPEMYSDLQLNTYLWLPNEFFNLYGNDRLPRGDNFRVAVGQFTPILGEIEKNLKKISNFAKEAKEIKAKYLVLPELAVTGKPTSLEEAKKLSTEQNANILLELENTAKENNLYLICGLIYSEANYLYNAAIIICSDGSKHVYKKSHLSLQDKIWAKQGNKGPLVINTPEARIGIIIGEEIAVMELPRLAALQGCDLLCVSAALDFCGETLYFDEELKWHMGSVRAGENNIWLFYANQKHFSGIFEPDAFSCPKKDIVLTSNEKIISLEIDTNYIIKNTKNKSIINKVRYKPRLSMRRTKWYDSLY